MSRSFRSEPITDQINVVHNLWLYALCRRRLLRAKHGIVVDKCGIVAKWFEALVEPVFTFGRSQRQESAVEAWCVLLFGLKNSHRSAGGDSYLTYSKLALMLHSEPVHSDAMA